MTERPVALEGDTVYARERYHQRYEYGELYSDQIVALSQVRKEKNIVSDRLRQGIQDNGLINPIDVAHVDGKLLDQYVEFVRQTWGDAADMATLGRYRQPDSSFNLLIAGHSRHQAIIDIEAETRKTTGVHTLYPIPIKIHDVDSVWDIIRLQLDENVHSQPPKERQAIALVEAYRYGERTGAWQTVDDFLSKQDENVSKNFMRQAMLFERLPAEIRSYVLSGPIPYYVGVELGVTAPVLRDFFRATCGEEAEIETLVRQELVILCNQIVTSNLNSTAGKTKVKAARQHWQAQTRALSCPREAAMELEFVSAKDAGRAMADKQRRTILEQLRQLVQLKLINVDTMVRLSAPFVGDDTVDSLIDRERVVAEKILSRTERLGNTTIAALTIL